MADKWNSDYDLTQNLTLIANAIFQTFQIHLPSIRKLNNHCVLDLFQPYFISGWLNTLKFDYKLIRNWYFLKKSSRIRNHMLLVWSLQTNFVVIWFLQIKTGIAKYFLGLKIWKIREFVFSNIHQSFKQMLTLQFERRNDKSWL